MAERRVFFWIVHFLSACGYGKDFNSKCHFTELRSIVSHANAIPRRTKIDALVAILLVAIVGQFPSCSFSSMNMLLPQDAYAEEEQDNQNSTCNMLLVQEASSIGYQGLNIPENVLDEDFNTRWSKEGEGSWIELDLGAQKALCDVGISWYQGDQRQNDFEISVSQDRDDYIVIYEGTSIMTNSVQEHYLGEGLDGSSIIARYIRVTVYGNTLNDWASITEIIINGHDIEGDNSIEDDNDNNDSACSDVLTVEDVYASGYEDSNPPENAIDGIDLTRWSNLGLGSSITLDLGKPTILCGLNIAWYNGNTRVNDFVISISDDDMSYYNILQGKSSRTLTPESYAIEDDKATYLKIAVTGNTLNDWVSISEIKVYGYVVEEEQEGGDNGGSYEYQDEIDELLSPASEDDALESHEKLMLLDYITYITKDNSEYDIRWEWEEGHVYEPLGWMYSQIVISNETSDTISGFVADTDGTVIDAYNDGCYVLVRYVHDPGFMSNIYLGARLTNGSFTIQIPDKFQDAETVVLYVSGNWFQFHTGLTGHYQYLGVKVNTAKLEYKTDTSLDPQKEYARPKVFSLFDLVQ